MKSKMNVQLVCVIFMLIIFTTGIFAFDFVQSYKDSYAAEKKGNFKKAYNIMKTAYENSNIKSDQYKSLMRLGYLSSVLKKYKNAAGLYANASGLYPDAVEPLISEQYMYLLQGDWAKLISICKSTLALDEKNYYSLSRLGYAYYYQGKYRKSLQTYLKVSNLYPMDTDIKTMMGWVTVMLGNKTLAKKYFNEVLMLSPANASARKGIKYVNK